MIVNGNIWVHYLDGSPPIKVTFEGRAASPLWTPDNQRVVFESTPLDDFRALRATPTDNSGAAAELVSSEGHFHPIGWSVDGTELIAIQEVTEIGTDWDIVKWSLAQPDDLEPVVQKSRRDGLDGAALSPDGRWPAYVTDQIDSLEIWVQSYPVPKALFMTVWRPSTRSAENSCGIRQG